MVYRLENVMITYNSITDILTITKNKEWLNITRNSFAILMTLHENKSIFDNVVAKQKTVKLEIQKLYGNFLLSCTSTDVIIPFTNEEIGDIYSDYTSILERIAAKGIQFCDDNYAIPDRFRRSETKSAKTVKKNNKSGTLEQVKLDM